MTLTRLLTAIGFGLLPASVALAQAEDRGRPASPPPTQSAPCDEGFRRGAEDREGEAPPGLRGPPWGRRRIEMLSQKLFRPAPADQGPLQPGEADELMDFARERAPRLYRALDALRQRDPARFQARLTEAAPRLRHLRRVWAGSPRMGSVIQAYAENLFDIQRGLRALRRSAPESASHQNDLERLRDLVAQSVRLETEALETLADELEQQRAERVDKRLAYLLSENADLSFEPPKLRELVQAYRSAEGDEQRRAERARIQELAARLADVEIEALRERAQRLREHAAEETDRRLERLFRARMPTGEESSPSLPEP